MCSFVHSVAIVAYHQDDASLRTTDGLTTNNRWEKLWRNEILAEEEEAAASKHDKKVIHIKTASSRGL